MFDSAVIRRPGLIDGRYDVGRVFETLLYYRRVHLILDVQCLSGLAGALGIDALRDLLSLSHVTADLVSPEMPGVYTTRSGLTVHNPVYMRYSGQRQRHDREYIEATHEYLSKQDWATGLRVATLRKALSRTKPKKYADIIGPETRDNVLFRSMAEDQETVHRVIEHLAARSEVSLDRKKLERLDHEIIKTPDGFVVASANLREVLQSSDITWANILSSIFEYSLDLQLAGTLSSDVIVDDASCELATSRIDLAIQRATRSAEQISSFEELVFDNAKYFSGAVNDGSLSVNKALSLIEKSADLRKWTSGLAPTSDLAQEYVAAVGAQQPLQSARSSFLRFFSFTGAGVALDVLGAGGIGTVAGVALSAFDQFLLGRLLGGWRPNTFANRLKRSLG